LTETDINTETETFTYMTVSSSTSISQPKAAQEILYNSNQRNILSRSSTQLNDNCRSVILHLTETQLR